MTIIDLTNDCDDGSILNGPSRKRRTSDDVQSYANRSTKRVNRGEVDEFILMYTKNSKQVTSVNQR